MGFLFAQWQGAFPKDISAALGKLRNDLKLAEALVAPAHEAAIAIVHSPRTQIPGDQLRSAIQNSFPDASQLTMSSDLEALKAFLLHASRLAQPSADVDKGYLQALQAGSISRTLGELYLLGLELRKGSKAYLKLAAEEITLEAFAHDLAHTVFGDLSAARIYLLGCSPEALSFARALAGSVLDNVLLSGTDTDAVLQASRELSCKCAPARLAPDKVMQTDILVCSEARCCQLLKTIHFKLASSRRHGLPMLVFELSPQPLIDPAVSRLDGVLLYTRSELGREMSGLQRIRSARLAQRATEIETAAQDFLAKVNQDSADIVLEAVQTVAERVCRREILKLQPVLERMKETERRKVTDALLRASRDAVSPLIRLCEASPSSCDAQHLRALIDSLSAAGDESRPKSDDQA